MYMKGEGNGSFIGYAFLPRLSPGIVWGSGE
jgi:hypothetical protein